MSSWRECKLVDIAEILNHIRVPLSAMERVKKQGKFPYYGASGIIDYVDDYLFDGEYVLISEDGENLKSRKTPIAFKANGKFWVNNHAHIIQGKKPFLNDLIVYFFKNLDLNEYITGAVQPKLNKANLLEIPFYLPESEEEQKAIAEVLSSLDDKIDLLHRQNKTLEDLAQTLFRQWFIEEAKEEWEEKPLGEIALHVKSNINPANFQNKSFLHFSLPTFDEGQRPKKELGSEILSNKYQVIKNSILVSKLNPRTPRIWLMDGNIDEDISICSTEFQVLKPKENIWRGFIYCFLKTEQAIQELTGASSGTSGSHQRVKPEDIFNLTFQYPDMVILKKFDELSSDYWQKIKVNQKQIQTLENLRDTLLPKLLSGEVSVKI